jgi:GT2 family glycosyltransferase
MREVDVAIAIVSYQSAALTIDCLRSIASERSTPDINIRVIIVDNASGDAPAIAEAIEANAWSSWVTLVQSPRNGGFGYGNNLAFARACDDRRPEYFHLLNPDTVVRPGAISALVRFLETHPDAAIAGGSFENLDGSDWPFAFRFPSIFSEIDSGLQFGLATNLLRRWTLTVRMDSVPRPVDWLPGASMMIRGDVFEPLGGFDERYFLYFEETDLCYRAKQAGYDTWYVPESRVMHIAGQCTKVTERNVAPRRLPAYWFESRRRYFVSNYGPAYAAAVDAAAILAHAFGATKRFLQRRTDRGIPCFLSDLAYHSAFSPKARVDFNAEAVATGTPVKNRATIGNELRNS